MSGDDIDSTPHGDILVIDDTPANLKLLAGILKEDGYQIRPATDGELALRSAHAEPPDLILLDIRMPGMDGFEVCRQLKASEDTQEIPVIFISGLDESIDKVKAFGLGGVDYILKPFEAEEVLARVRTHLSIRRMQQQLEEQNLQLREAAELLERRVEQRTEELSESEERFRSVTQSANDAIITIDEQSIIVSWNIGATKIFGRDEKEMVGSNMDLIMPEDSRAAHNAAMKRLSSGNESRRKLEGTVEHKGLRKNGEVFPFELSLSIWNSGGKSFYSGILRDISERKKAEVEQERLHRELQHSRKMEALGQLTGGIAHDFNNILGIILGNTELALQHYINDNEAKQAGYLKRVIEAGERARDLVAKMLSFSQGQSRNDEPLQFQSVLAENLSLLRSMLPASIEIDTKFEENLPAILMDQTQLNQILMILCANAQDAMKGKGIITIGLGWAKEVTDECSICHKPVEGDWIELSVMDTGCGIKPSELHHIFDPFYTTKEMGSEKGTGMGLAVVQGIVGHHGGHILVETEQDKGTTVRMLFSPADEENIKMPVSDQSAADRRKT